MHCDEQSNQIKSREYVVYFCENVTVNSRVFDLNISNDQTMYSSKQKQQTKQNISKQNKQQKKTNKREKKNGMGIGHWANI